jgi:hypothetical protein
VICNDDTEKRDAGYESVTNSAWGKTSTEFWPSYIYDFHRK